MRILVRIMGLSLIGLGVLLMLLHLSDLNVYHDELHDIAALAMKQTQLLMMENIEDRYYGTSNARLKINDNESYLQLYKDSLYRLKKSDAEYEVEVLAIDYEKGLLCLKIDCNFILLNGTNKNLSYKLLNIIDVKI